MENPADFALQNTAGFFYFFFLSFAVIKSQHFNIISNASSKCTIFSGLSDYLFNASLIITAA